MIEMLRPVMDTGPVLEPEPVPELTPLPEGEKL